jgi:hypothetical protein
MSEHYRCYKRGVDRKRKIDAKDVKAARYKSQSTYLMPLKNLFVDRDVAMLSKKSARLSRFV